MEAKFAQSFQFPVQIDSERIVWRSSSSIPATWQCSKLQHPRMLTVSQSQQKKTANRHRPVQFEVSGSFQHSPAPNLESRSVKPSFDDASILKEKSQEIVPYLNGRSIYLVGMMGCGKTTVGKVLSEVLNYSFVDSDKLIEQTMGELSVAEIFNLYGEKFFRDMETEVLLELSLRHRTVASTGGGAVIRPINWEYMQGGISVWLDVPLKALAQRIAAVGTKSRPLLQIEPGDVIEKTYGRLSALWEERSEAYANADARVSLERIAAKLGQRDVSSLTPEVIAIEVLEQIMCFLREEDGMNIPEL